MLKKWFLMAALSLLSPSLIRAQTVEQTLFGDIEKALEQARAQYANLYSPRNYDRATAEYKGAVEDFKANRNLNIVRERVKRADGYLKAAAQNVVISRSLFAGVMAARQDALKANAPEFAKEAYEAASRRFTEAASSVEGGDVEAAKRRGAEAEEMFKKAELTAIQASIVGNVRKLLEYAGNLKADSYAPRTVASARSLLTEAEKQITSNRYDRNVAREKAEQAEYQAQIAIHLSRLFPTLDADAKKREDFILALQDSIGRVSEEIGFPVRFDQGFDAALSTLRLAARNLRQEGQSLSQNLAARTKESASRAAEIDRLRRELAVLKGQKEELAAREAAQAQALAAREAFEQKIRGIEGLFSADEGTVIRQGDNLIVRLHGLTFKSGSAQLTPQNFLMLAKVQSAIREFPDAAVEVGGHTDSAGNDDYNQVLSERRAQAVRDHLLKSLNLPEGQITAVGYGETKPVANNATEEGRARNRRIDIVMTLKQ
ncbi:MAG: hypothetical protein A3F84_26025 [Candidatus Handelsmanbacteria bacterium RIFCSPLOWO2_12_FULL_64_10]|uniref:OmpA-like domain-containing protein n=1 Tax=Handelsmanbacteria sp. (strain RIFCSPLOWO2_12_FULL_64_10) TaxID=1817868 RepID=A0A1F6CA26_HANXR|nr:MAG: hypothetical protein A3F84_26025 [Candidatus Handelsmanbacteria bacterium RIFCSPLOWO2_12_FULL_64_10]